MPAYMKYAGITGEVTGKFKGWIKLTSIQFGVGRGITSPSGRPSERESSAPSISEIVVTKSMDSTSPLLFQESLMGKPVKVIIELTMDDKLETVYLHVEMEEAMISGYSVSSGGDKPSESLSINFNKISYKYTVATTPPATVKSP